MKLNFKKNIFYTWHYYYAVTKNKRNVSDEIELKTKIPVEKIIHKHNSSNSLTNISKSK